MTDQNQSKPSLDSQEPNKLWVPWGFVASIVFGLSVMSVQFLIAVILIISAPTFVENLADSAVLTQLSLQLAITGITFGLVYAIVKAYKGDLRTLGFRKIPLKQYGMVIPTYFVYMAVLIAVSYALSGLIPAEILEQEQEIGFKTAQTNMELVGVFLALVVIPPLLEEAIFRGFIFRGMIRAVGPVFAAIISSLLFAFAHLQINVGIDTFILGLGLAFLTYKTRSIWPAVALHALKNGIAFALLFIVGV